MTDHALLSGIGDCSALQVSHGRKRFLNLRPHFLEEIVRKIHPADVERKIEISVIQKILLKNVARAKRTPLVKNARIAQY
jgi:hypothetical protein